MFLVPYSQAEKKLRVIQRIIKLFCRLLQQDKEGVHESVFELAAQSLSQIYALINCNSNNPQISSISANTSNLFRESSKERPIFKNVGVLQDFFQREAYPALKYAVGNLGNLGDHLKLTLCRIMEDIEGNSA